MQQEVSQRATDGLQPVLSDTEEFQAEGMEGGKVPGGREAQNEEGGSHLRFVVKGDCYMRKEENTLLKLYGISPWSNIERMKSLRLVFSQSHIVFVRRCLDAQFSTFKWDFLLLLF